MVGALDVFEATEGVFEGALDEALETWEGAKLDCLGRGLLKASWSERHDVLTDTGFLGCELLEPEELSSDEPIVLISDKLRWVLYT